ncbi:MAG: hypothetical protein L0G99_01920, partial [Propionibacteriales bacterium]|nr:hypothetical protein [Propionibacteriales bacterium]
MECPRCRAELPEVSRFCHRCGQDMHAKDSARRNHFAVKPDEPVASFALMSTIMPRGAAERPQTYRMALLAFLVVALVAAIFGAVPIAIMVAVVAIPLVYIIYLYDVNLWDDAPIPVTAMAFGLTFVLGLLFTLIWQNFFAQPISLGGAGSGFQVGSFLLVALVVPIIGEAIRQIGPIFLASRPAFDDLMDGLTFGVISGVAYSAAETLVIYWPSLTGGMIEWGDPGTWIGLIFLQGFIKPLILGTATGIACAEFSGLGKGFDGFTPRYYRGLIEAVAANIAFGAGLYLISTLGQPTVVSALSVLWGLIVLGVLIIRIRTVLHVGLMEAALEAAARDNGVGPEGDLAFCGQCEMPLVSGSAFCSACGASARGQFAKPHRTAVPAVAVVGAGAVSGGAALGPVSGSPSSADSPNGNLDEPTLAMERPLNSPSPDAAWIGDREQLDASHPPLSDQGDWFAGDEEPPTEPGVVDPSGADPSRTDGPLDGSEHEGDVDKGDRA